MEPGKDMVHFFSLKNCENQSLSVFIVILVQVVLLLVLSNVLHLLLKPLGQPSVISQMLAGIMIGPTGLGSWLTGTHFAIEDSSYLTSVGAVGRIFFMFLIGLEMDIPYLKRSAWRATAVAYGGVIFCMAAGAASAPLIRWEMGTKSHDMLLFAAIIMLLFANTSAPVLIRMANELKIGASEVGRLAISACLVNDVTCLVFISLVSSFGVGGATIKDKVMPGVRVMIVLAPALLAVRPVTGWLNRRNRRRRYIRNWEVGGVMIFVLGASALTEVMGYNSMMTSFVMGLVFPRVGSTTRTLEDKLTSPVNNIFLPIYFGFTGFQANLGLITQLRLLSTVITIVVLSTAAKVAGTIVVTTYLKIPFHEGVVLGFLLNVKGHVDLLILSLARRSGVSMSAYRVLLVAVVINTLVAGPAASAVVRLDRKAVRYRSAGLQWRELGSELRVLACVHLPQELPTMLDLIQICNGAGRTPLAAYVIHLVQLTRQVSNRMLYHQIEDDHDGDDWDSNGRQIVSAVDAFRSVTGITTRLMTAVSALSDMHWDVCNGAEDVHATVAILPFHKHQLVDGRMHGWRDGVRGVNLRVLRHAPCTVGIFVDRGLGGDAQAAPSTSSHHVAVLFFGGPDDREAVAFGSRLAVNPSVSLTVVRFLPASGKGYSEGIQMQASKDDEVLTSISNHEMEAIDDQNFLSKLYNSRDAALGAVGYTERYVENGAETVAALASMVGTYSLYLVGRGRRALSPLTVGMSDWEQYPELGPVGDLLASSDFMTVGSVLVLQQCNHYSDQEDLDGEFTVL